MKFLCVGDIHIKLDNSHLIDILQKHIVDYIQLYDIKYVILMGDILHYHEKLHTQCLNRACELIENIRHLCHVICLVGNHDYIQNAQFCTTNHWMNPLKKWDNVTIVDNPIQIDECIFTPYVPPGRFIEALDMYTPNWINSKYIFAHQEFKGCKMGAIISTSGDDWKEQYPIVISGHIHDKQRPQNNIYYIGASLQHSFGETGYPILLLLDIIKNHTEELLLKLPRKKTLYTNLDEVKSLKLENSRDDLDCIRIVVKGDYEKFKVFQKSEQFERLQINPKCKIVFKPEETKINENNRDDDKSIKFKDLLHRNVLLQRNEKLYSIYENIIYDTEVDENNILII